MLENIILQRKVAEATQIIETIEMNQNRKGVLIKFDGS